MHNAYIAGYIGYTNLAKLAGLTDQDLQPQQAELQRLFDLRVSTFSKDSPYPDGTFNYSRELNIARNFMFLVPELSDYLRVNLPTGTITETINEYNNVAPYWFVSKHEASLREGVISPLYNYHAIFQAKAQILKEPREELLKYLDIPGVKIGDLFYIDNLVSVLEASSSGTTPTPSPFTPGDVNEDGQVNSADVLQVLSNWLSTGLIPEDINQDNKVNGMDFGVIIKNWGL